MVDIQTVSIAVASASVALAAIYYIWQFRHQNKIRQIELINAIYSSTRTREFQEAYEKIYSRKIPTDLIEYKRQYGTIEFNMIILLYDQAGILFQKKLLDDELIQYFFGDGVIRFWEAHKHMFQEEERRLGKPHMWTAIEDLYNEMKKRKQKQ